MPSKTTLAIVVAFAATASVLAAPAAPSYYDYELAAREYNDAVDLEARFYDYEDDLFARQDAPAPDAGTPPQTPAVETPPQSAASTDGAPPHPHHGHHGHHHHHHHHMRRRHTLRRRDLDLEDLYTRQDAPAPDAGTPPQTPAVETPPQSAASADGAPPHPHHGHHGHHHHHHHHMRRRHTLRRRDLVDADDLYERGLFSGLFGHKKVAELSTDEVSRLDGMKKDCEAVTDKKAHKKCLKQVKKIRKLEKRLKYLNKEWTTETGKPLPPHAHSAASSGASSPTPPASSASSPQSRLSQ